MNDIYIKLNCLETLQQNFKKYIVAFVAYYGEDKKEEIIKKFSNALPLAYITPEGLSLILNNLYKEKSEELIKKAMSFNETHLSKETIFGQTILGQVNYEYKIQFPINAYLEFKKAYDLGKTERKKQAIINTYNLTKKYIPELTIEESIAMSESKTILEKYNNYPTWIKNNILNISNIEKQQYEEQFKKAKELITKVSGIENLEDFTNENEEIKKLNILAEKYEETIQEYNTFKQQFKPYSDEIKKNLNDERKIKKDCYKELLINSNFLFNEKEQEKIRKYISGESNFLDSDIENIIGRSLTTDSPLEMFSEKNQEALNKENWRAKYIIDDRIKYFNAKGINLGNDYEAYLNSDETKKIWPTKEQISKLKELKEKLQAKAEKTYYENTSYHKKLKELVDAKDYIIKDDSIDVNLYQSYKGNFFVSPNLKKEGQQYKLSPIVCICFNDDIGTIEHYIIHELNHLFELNFEGIVDNKAKFICGWDITEADITSKKQDYLSKKQTNDKKRKYELFNEIINELIAQEIHFKMRENNISILDKKNTSKIKNLTSYENYLFLVKGFYNEFKEDIIKSRNNGNINEIFNAVGKENFDELNSLIEIYYENFGGLKLLSLINSLENKEDNQMTQIYYDLLNRKEQILEKMRTVKENKTEKNLSI